MMTTKALPPHMGPHMVHNHRVETDHTAVCTVDSDPFGIAMVLEAASTRPTSLKSRKRCSFDMKSNKVHRVDHINDLPGAEIEATWYSRVDIRRIKFENMELLRRMKGIDLKKLNEPISTMDFDLTEDCLRGLELVLDPRSYQQAKERRLESRDVVLQYQKRYKNESGKDREHAIAAAYRRSCHPAVDMAIKMGGRDESDAALENRSVQLDEREIFFPSRRPLYLPGVKSILVCKQIPLMRVLSAAPSTSTVSQSPKGVFT